MTLSNFLSFLQQLLSMIEPRDKYSVALAKNALSATVALARESGKADAETVRAMVRAEEEFEYLAENARDFIGRPGEYNENEKRRRRLSMMLIPSC